MQDSTNSDEVFSFLPRNLLTVPASVPFVDMLPSLPIMTSTRLQLELLFSDSVIDLKAVTDVILSDAGATLQILRVVGEEYLKADDRPIRMEDCIVSLSMRRCYEAVCGTECELAGLYVAEWQYCRRVAECARELARVSAGISPEEAYLVGLLYRLGKFPQLLGWKLSDSTLGEKNALGVMLACHWKLPDYLLTAIREQQETARSPRWKSILLLAVQMVEQASS